MSELEIFRISFVLGSKVWLSDPGGSKRVTSALSLAICLAKSYCGKSEAITLSLVIWGLSLEEQAVNSNSNERKNGKSFKIFFILQRPF